MVISELDGLILQLYSIEQVIVSEQYKAILGQLSPGSRRFTSTEPANDKECPEFPSTMSGKPTSFDDWQGQGQSVQGHGKGPICHNRVDCRQNC